MKKRRSDFTASSAHVSLVYSDCLASSTHGVAFQDDGKLVGATIAALAGDDLTIVASTAAVDPSSYRSSGRVHVERYLPHAHVLEHAACVVCHGGWASHRRP